VGGIDKGALATLLWERRPSGTKKLSVGIQNLQGMQY